LATKSINNTLVDVDGEFSFNLVVGERTEKRGYKKSKVILNGEFADGIGGGVCQVSTTLYNAVLLAGLEIVEYHPHSLPVTYVAPSFDAMVNSTYADLKFRNNTKNPVIVKGYADGNIIKIEILGQKMNCFYERESLLVQSVPIPESQVVFDEKGEYPDIFKGEFKQVRFGKEGYISQGYLVKVLNGKRIKRKIRQDKYSATRGLIVYGNAEKPIESLDGSQSEREILQN
jgi:vancomycin resistance protein YoaR